MRILSLLQTSPFSASPVLESGISYIFPVTLLSGSGLSFPCRVSGHPASGNPVSGNPVSPSASGFRSTGSLLGMIETSPNSQSRYFVDQLPSGTTHQIEGYHFWLILQNHVTDCIPWLILSSDLSSSCPDFFLLDDDGD